ncbi:MAG: hypothetical protein RL385_1167 [Pseudomonadota bacterium]
MQPHPTRIAHHQRRQEDLTQEDVTLERRENRVSMLRLAAFLGAAAALIGGVTQGSPALWSLALLLALGFFVGVVLHARLAAARARVAARQCFHGRELARLHGDLTALPVPAARAKEGHPYASDIDLTGPGSLLQRIDTTRTQEGELALIDALSAPAPLPLIRARQAAVEALAKAPAFREDLWTAAGAIHPAVGAAEKLTATPFFALLERPSAFAGRPWLRPTMWGLSGLTGLLLVLSSCALVPWRALWIPVLIQGLLLFRLSPVVHPTLSLLTTRLGFAEAYLQLFHLLEQHTLDAPHLARLRADLRANGALPSTWMKRLSRYEGLAQLRTQGPLYIVLNALTLWDLYCLDRIDRFIAEVGPHCRAWFEALAELEVCAAFAALRYGDEESGQAEVVDGEAGLIAEGLLHPLLPAGARVPNDLSLFGPGTAIVITGSNMAGKSTLLRALGLNVVLALAGGPVSAGRLVLGRVRLRASMRIDDSLQRGASYFHAELARLRTVVGELDQGPPVLFLLDELLRGTNAHARHKGARAVVLHLLAHRAMGLVATHDIALSELETELPGRVQNVHFTDVFEKGEMRFDYRLRAGVVKTSNALRLLALAGVDVEVDDSLGNVGQ